MDGDFPDIPAVPDMADERPFSVRRWDLDRNNHVNNAVYFSWAAETGPEETALTCSLVRVDGEYLRPTEGRGDIRVRTSRQEDLDGFARFLHSIVGPEGDEKARFITCWKRE
jgi:acyl-ACP thioesterase